MAGSTAYPGRFIVEACLESLDYNTHFRIALLHPSEDENRRIVCNLITVAWAEEPEFVFVDNSSDWKARMNEQTEISLESRPFPVSVRLDVALRRLRSRVEPRRLFIPDLCMSRRELSTNFPVLRRALGCALGVLDTSEIVDKLEEGELQRLTEISRGCYEDFPPYMINLTKVNLHEHRFSGRFNTNAGDLAPYSYTLLDETVGEIRLLRVEFPRSNEDLIRFDLIHRPLRTAGEFQALSYTWGDASYPVAIEIDGHSLNINRNLYDFFALLAKFHYRDKRKSGDGSSVSPDEHSVLEFWIDSICLNQQDLTEKSKEIQRMSEIYAAAKSVVAWIGKTATPLSEGFVQAMREGGGNLRQKAVSTATREEIEKQPDFFKSLATLLLQSFFTRAWCTQELILAKKIELYSESGILEWETLADLSPYYTDRPVLLKYIANIHADRLEKLNLIMGVPIARAQLVERVQTRREAKKPVTLLAMLLATMHLGCTVPKDKIYSLWSLADDAAELLPYPDYSISDVQVFTDFTKAWILRYNRLDILSTTAACAGRQTWNCPSWVTDWSGEERHSTPLISTYPCILRDDSLDEVESQRIYDASKGAGMYCGFYGEWGLLASGISCDVIRSVGEPGLMLLPSSWIDVVNQLPEQARSDLYHAIIAGRDPAGQRVEGAGVDPCWLYEEDKINDHNALAIRMHIARIISGRRLAITHKGHVGLVPSQAEVGDEVAVVYGCSVPLVFRVADHGERAIVGDAYFHRMMDGQMVAEAGDFKEFMKIFVPDGVPNRPTQDSSRPQEITDVESVIVCMGSNSLSTMPEDDSSFRRCKAEEALRLPSGRPARPGEDWHKSEVPESMQRTLADRMENDCRRKPTLGGNMHTQMFLIGGVSQPPPSPSIS